MHGFVSAPLLCVLLFCLDIGGTASGAAELKNESFDHDPSWEGFNNHLPPRRVPTVTQDFGFRTSNFSGRDKGEIGGQVWRSSTRASYAASIAAKSLGEKFTASGSFAVTATSGSSGAFFGWFNSWNTGIGRRDTLGFRFAGAGSGSRLTLQLVTDKNQACGTKVTPWIVDKTKPKGEGRKVRPPSIRNDGTRYAWTLEYDPGLNDGQGQIKFTIRRASAQPEVFEAKPHIVALPNGYKEQGTTFDRFGLMNCEKGGNPMTIYFDDLSLDGKAEDFSKDPGWIGSGNQASFEDRHQGGAHDFGFCPQTSQAGGSPGELGGLVWRSGLYGYYADCVGPLGLTNRLEARGKVVLRAAPPDSGLYFGWFNSAPKQNSPAQVGGFIGAKIGGPTRVGHYFVPAYAVSSNAKTKAAAPREHLKRAGVEARQGPVLVPDKVFEWRLIYDPVGNNGTGTLETALASESVTLPLKQGDNQKGATYDRFGLFTAHIGGSYVRIYFDDLKYTASP